MHDLRPLFLHKRPVYVDHPAMIGIRFLILMTFIYLSTFSHARASYGGVDLRLLPEYCSARYTRNIDIAEYKKWEAKYGPDLLHAHHFCRGIALAEHQYMRESDSHKRKGLLMSGISEYDYMIRAAAANSKLLPDAHWYRGRAFLRLNRYGEAIADMAKAIELDPTQDRYRVSAAEAYISIGKKSEALKVLHQGLEANPASKTLRKLYLEHGGRETDFPAVESTDNLPARDLPSTQKEPNEDNTQPTAKNNYAVFVLNKQGGGDRSRPSIRNAGSYVLLELFEASALEPNKIRFRISSRIPEPNSSVGVIGIDIGPHTGLIEKIESDSMLGKFYNFTDIRGTPYKHPYWYNFKADYLAKCNIDPKLRKASYARCLSPGQNLTFTITFRPDITFVDVVDLIKKGMESGVNQRGLQFAVILFHLDGPPLPTGTRGDDAGFHVGTLLRADGPHTESRKSDASNISAPRPTNQATPVQAEEQGTVTSKSAQDVARPSSSLGKESNPWCRFCPE